MRTPNTNAVEEHSGFYITQVNGNASKLYGSASSKWENLQSRFFFQNIIESILMGQILKIVITALKEKFLVIILERNKEGKSAPRSRTYFIFDINRWVLVIVQPHKPRKNNDTEIAFNLDSSWHPLNIHSRT